MRRRYAGAVLTYLLAFAIPAEALVFCTMPDGEPFAGDKPPPGCLVKEEYANPTPAPETPNPQGFVAEPTPDPLAEWRAKRGADREQRRKDEAELERRKNVKALVVEKWFWTPATLVSSSIQGWVRNVADFPVYSARVCLFDQCVATSPSVLQAGMSGDFRFEVAGGTVPDAPVVAYWKTEP